MSDNAVTTGPKRFVAVLGPSRRTIRVTARLADNYRPPYGARGRSLGQKPVKMLARYLCSSQGPHSYRG
jgi:hypothetical protein